MTAMIELASKHKIYNNAGDGQGEHHEDHEWTAAGDNTFELLYARQLERLTEADS